MSRWTDPHDEAAEEGGGPERERRGIQSIETGSRLLLALSDSPTAMTLTELARTVGIAPTKAYPYLVSLAKHDFVAQHPQTGRYDLGAAALQIGLSSMRRLDPIKIGIEEIEPLAAETSYAIALAVWGNLGPTIVHFEEARVPLYVYLKPGTVMSLLYTATGKAFAAYMPAKTVETMMRGDGFRWGAHMAETHPLGRDEVEAVLSEVRRHGLARELQLVPGVTGLSAPAFNHRGRAVMAVTLTGSAADFDGDWDGPAAQALRATAGRISTRLGYQGA